MVCKCCVPLCNNTTIIKGISFYAIPKDLNLRNQWITAIDIEAESITVSTKVCSCHFNKDDYFTFSSSNRCSTKLKKNVVPSLFLPPRGISVPDDENEKNKTERTQKLANAIENPLNKKMKTESKKNILHSQDWEMVFNVYQFMKNESEAGLIIPLNCLQDRVARAAGVSLSTVKRVGQEGAAKPTGSKFMSPKRIVNKSSPKSSINQFDERVIRNIIYTQTIINRKRPTMNTIFQAVKNEGVILTGKITSFRKIIRKLGFHWKKSDDNRKLLCEKTDIRLKRIEFLRKLKTYKNEGRNIVYYGETCIHSLHNVSKPKEILSDPRQKSRFMKNNRLEIVHCGGRKGFVPNAALIFKYGIKIKDYQDKMNYTNHTNWLNDKLLPNLEKNSVLVIDNASYQNVLVEPSPTFESSKADLRKWLNERNIFFAMNETKPELYQKVQLNKPLNKWYALDTLLADHGHSVLRLPPYHTELNPIEKVWEIIKHEVDACNEALDGVWKLAEEKLASFSIEQWENVCDLVENVEEEYMIREYITDEVQEDIIRVVDESDESDDGFSSDDDDDD